MFKKLTNHIYVRAYEHHTDRPNIGLICGTNRALLYDAGNSAAHVALMKQELADRGLPFPDYVALSHWHWDHTFGAHAWDANIVAGRNTDRHLRHMQTWKWDDTSMQDRLDRGIDIPFCSEMIKREYPDRSAIRVASADIVFDERMTLDLGGEVICELIHARGPHSEDSIICYIPLDKFVFLGDSNGKDLYGLPWHFDIAHEEDFSSTVGALPYDLCRVQAYIRLLDTLDFTYCIGGHSNIMSRVDLYQKLIISTEKKETS